MTPVKLYRYFLCLLLLASVRLFSQPQFHYLQPDQNIIWNSLTGNNGLSQNSITSIIQDSKGFIWIGTYDGLNRFDGFSTIIKRHESKNPNSLSDNRILFLDEDKLGNILIATEGGGLNIYNPSTDSFTNVSNQPKANLLNKANTMCTDKNGNIWFGGDGVSGVIPATKSGYDFRSTEILNQLAGSNVHTLLNDDFGNVWIGTDQGLFVCEANTESRQGKKQLKQVNGLANVPVYATCVDNHQNIWIGTNGGLYTVSLASNRLSNEVMVKDRYAQMFGQEKNAVDISSVTFDRQNNLWVGSRNNGLFKFNATGNDSFVKAGAFNTEQPYCNILENMLRVLFVDKSNTLWVGSYTKGVNYTNLSNKKFYAFTPLLSNERNEFGYKSVYVTTVAETESDVWIGTYKNGLYKYNKQSNSLENYGKNIFKTENIICLLRSKNNTLWIGTNAGLFKAAGK